MREGTRLTTAAGDPVVVRRPLGRGGQGEVFAVEWRGRPHALKWYHAPDPEQRRALAERLIPKGPPDNDTRFLWPLALVEDAGRFGYLMELYEPRFRGLEELIGGHMQPPPSFATLCRFAIELADCYRRLHLAGHCYKDISFGNAVFDPQTGDVRICDNDNVRVNNAPAGNIIGTGPFMAPEIWRGEARPSIDTDRHSLAVLLFYLAIRNHPLEGARESSLNAFTEQAKCHLYGTHALFIHDPDDASNRPVPGYHDAALRNWPAYPEALRDVFTHAFTVGLRDPRRRVTESEWMSAFSRLRDAIFYCLRCGQENFYDRARIQEGARCLRCRSALALPMRMRIGTHVVMLNHDRRLYGHHLGADLDFGAPVAEVARHPQDPAIWGLRNTGPDAWTYDDGGQVRTIPPGRSVTLRDGLTINFGRARGAIRAAG